MNANIVSTTEIQRNFRQVLKKLDSAKEPLMIVRDSQPEAVMMTFSEYKRLSSLEKEIVKIQMERIWDEMRRKNKHVSDEEIDKAVTQARKYAKRSSGY